ncbi:8199_t:CDS:2, partial [Funneliformis geosporum]
MPGWGNNSWDYHNNDGNKNSPETNILGSGLSYGPKFITGDIIGCFINFRNNMILYTRNGINLGIAFCNLKNCLYPFVGIESPGRSIVRANLAIKIQIH